MSNEDEQTPRGAEEGCIRRLKVAPLRQANLAPSQVVVYAHHTSRYGEEKSPVCSSGTGAAHLRAAAAPCCS